MSRVTEIRQFQIPPCKVDKDLIVELGKTIQSDPLFKKIGARYYLNAYSRRIESDDYANFTAADWPDNVKTIAASLGEYPAPVDVEINFKYPDLSKVKISSDDATWADGFSKQLETVFEKRKLSYHSIVRHWYLKGLISLLTWVSLALALTYPLTPVFNMFEEATIFEVFVIISFAGGMLGGVWVLYAFLGWLLPHFEFGEPLQKRVRKWIWSLLVSSGFLATLIFKVLDL
jgi:hypothetical protein